MPAQTAPVRVVTAPVQSGNEELEGLMRMQSVNRWLGVIAAACLLVISGGVGIAAADEQDPTSVVRTYVTALDSGDAVAASSVFTDTAIHIHPIAFGACSRQSPCIGRKAILDDLQNRTVDHQCLKLLDVSVNGTVVRGTAELRNDTLRGMGIERVVVSSSWLISGGKAMALFVLPDLTDPQTAASAAISAGLQQASAPLPAPDPPCG
jgi:hypothetical protein